MRTHTPEPVHRPDLSCSTLSKPLAPEDVRRGDYVAILRVTCELPSFLWCAESYTLPADEPVRIAFVPAPDQLPLRVKSLSLPFVLVKSPAGTHHIIDMRQCRLARLDSCFARRAWKAGKKPRRHPNRQRVPGLL
jgi:hypothetical protein